MNTIHNQTYKIAALYRFVPIEDIPALRKAIQDFGKNCTGMCGTILLAPEGVNGTIGAFPDDLDRMIGFLDEKLGIEQGELKYSYSQDKPFNRFKVRPKKEIITMKCPEADPNKLVGEYVDPENWDALVNDPDVILVDTRNDYEVKVGTFRNAVDPDIDVFTEFPQWVEDNLDPAKNKKVAMFCTGGIRCEKASSYMLAQGFENVYHLKGGILKYLEAIPADQSSWDGECFVFDKRVSVTHGLAEGTYEVCHGCREPLSADDLEDEAYKPGISCRHCVDTLTPERRKILQDRHDHYVKNADLYT